MRSKTPGFVRPTLKFSGVPSKVTPFQELLSKMLSAPRSREKLLKTAILTGYITDGGYLSRMTGQEKQQVERKHWDAVITDPFYSACKPFDLFKSLPEKLGPPLTKAESVSFDGIKSFVKLSAGDHFVLVERVLFHTLHNRHPNSVWRLAHSERYWESPVVILKSDGFFAGELAGAIQPVPLTLKYPPLDTLAGSTRPEKVATRIIYRRPQKENT